MHKWCQYDVTLRHHNITPCPTAAYSEYIIVKVWWSGLNRAKRFLIFSLKGWISAAGSKTTFMYLSDFRHTFITSALFD